MNYLGKFNPSVMKYTLQRVERRLVKWAICKYKKFRRHSTDSRKLALVCKKTRS